jgi:hypothetical protein
MSNLVNSQMLEQFMGEVKQIFPSMIAGVIADRHGLVMHSKIESPKLDEEMLAVSAITDRPILDLSDYHKVVRPLGMNARIMVLLEKSYSNLHRFKQFNEVLNSKNPLQE